MNSTSAVAGTRPSVVRQVSLRFGARLAATVLQAVTLLVLARGLGASDFGAFSVALATGYLLSGLLGFGSSTRLLRLQAEAVDDQPRLVGTLYVLRAVGVLVAMCVVVALQPGTFAIWAAPLVVADAAMDFEQSRCSGKRQHGRAARLVIAQRLVPLPAAAVVLTSPTLGMTLFVVAQFVVLGLATVATVRGGMARPERVLHNARASAGYWLSSVASNISQLEVIVLRAAAGADIVGGYAISTRLANPLTVFVAALQTVVVPEYSTVNDARAWRTLTRRLVLLTLIYAGILAVLSPVIVWVTLAVLGSSYDAFHMLLFAMVWASALSAVSQVFQAQLLARGRPFLTSCIVLVGSSVGLALLAVAGIVERGRFIWIVPLATQAIILVGMAIASAHERRKFR